MTELQIIKGVECYIDSDGVAQLKLENVARGLGLTFVATSGNEVVRWNRVTKYLEEFGFATSDERPEFIPEPVFYLLCMKAENETAKVFQHTVAYEILPAIRKHGMYAIDDLLENPDLLIQAATQLKEERQLRKFAESEKEKLQLELDYSKQWYSIKRVAAKNGVSWKSFDWRKLKRVSEKMGVSARKIFDANYGEVNVYHESVWEAVYPHCEL